MQNSFNIHYCNLQKLVTEDFEVKIGLAQVIMNEVFDIVHSSNNLRNQTTFRSKNIHTIKYGSGPSIKYVRKIFRKTNISNPLIRTRTCAYQGVRNISFSENFSYVLNGWPLLKVSHDEQKQPLRNF